VVVRREDAGIEKWLGMSSDFDSRKERRVGRKKMTWRVGQTLAGKNETAVRTVSAKAPWEIAQSGKMERDHGVGAELT
jgi:hypothetical protein